MQARIRDIEDSLGACVRLAIAPHPSGAIVTLERRDLPGFPQLMLNQYGAEILTAFIMAARLSMPHAMPEEVTEGPFASSFHLVTGHHPAIVIEQDNEGDRISIPATMWDRLYAELCLATAHGREFARRQTAAWH